MDRLARHPLSLRNWLTGVAIAGVLGALLVAAMAGWWSWEDQRERVGASLFATSRAISESVERELDQAVALARGLALSHYLANDQLQGFEEQARELIGPYGYDLVLRSPNSGRQLINTETAAGTQPSLIDPVDPTLHEGRIYVSPLRKSRYSGAWFTAVDVPVLKADGQLHYVISILVPSIGFQRIIDEQHLPASWTPVILDTDWTVVARDIGRKKFLGEKGAGRQFQHAPDGLHDVRLLDGDAAVSAHSHSKRYGWTAAVAIPKTTMLQEAIGPIAAGAVSAFAVAALAIGVVLLFAARVGRGIGALADATKPLGSGQAIELPRFAVRELAIVGEGMQHAAAEIAASRRNLETRIDDAIGELRRETEERLKAEAALAHSQKLEALGQLTGGVAHDFNNLLAVIAGNLELIELKSAEEQTKAWAQGALRGIARGARLVDALLAFARKQPLRLEVVNPNLVIKEFAPMLTGAAGDTVQVQFLLSPTVYPCRVDAAQLQAAILNLVTNAKAAMPDGGRITIETENTEIDTEPGADLKPGSYVVITVGDTGIGMSPEVAARAFEPFFTTKEPGAGTGLGLSQVYGFAKQSGGHARVFSEEGIGTTVHLYLPRSLETAAVAGAASAETLRNRSITPATIMVVDDDPDVRDVLIASVAALGYRVLHASNGYAALARITAGEQVDLVLTDYMMPGGMTGRELGRRIVGLGRNIRVMLISGNIASEDEAGTFPLLQKPFQLSRLSRAIATALSD